MLGKQKERRLRHRKLKSPAGNAVKDSSAGAMRQQCHFRAPSLSIGNNVPQ
jgi:hypothetical protein